MASFSRAFSTVHVKREKQAADRLTKKLADDEVTLVRHWKTLS